MKRRYPLFIIDSSRAHGRGLDTDYISCTSAELPFVCEVTYISEAQFQKEYDRANVLLKYSLEHHGFRIRLEVVQVREGYDPTSLRLLLQRALNEMERHRAATIPRSASISDANKLAFLDELIKQGRQQQRRQPDNPVAGQSLAILDSIRDDYLCKL